MGQGTACPNSLPQAATDLSLLVTAQTKVCAVFVARPKELESLTFGSVDQRSIQLSYAAYGGRNVFILYAG